MSIRGLEKCSNLKTNWYKHFKAHFKHSIVSEIFWFGLKEVKTTIECQKMPLGGVKIIKSQIIQQICQLEVSKLTKPEKQLVKTFLNTFQASHNPQFFFI